MNSSCRKLYLYIVKRHFLRASKDAMYPNAAKLNIVRILWYLFHLSNLLTSQLSPFSVSMSTSSFESIMAWLSGPIRYLFTGIVSSKRQSANNHSAAVSQRRVRRNPPRLHVAPNNTTGVHKWCDAVWLIWCIWAVSLSSFDVRTNRRKKTGKTVLFAEF